MLYSCFQMTAVQKRQKVGAIHELPLLFVLHSTENRYIGTDELAVFARHCHLSPNIRDN